MPASPSRQERIDGLWSGLFPSGRTAPPGEQALASGLLEALGSAEVDMPGLVGRWAAVPPASIECPAVRAAIGYLRDAGAPIPVGSTPAGLGAAVATVMIATKVPRGSRNLVSATYHLARLLDPNPVGAFAAVATAVAAAAWFDGRADFVPDVLDVLLSNDAPGELVAEVRRVPIWDRPPSEGEPSPTARDFGQLLWILQHQHGAERAIAALAIHEPSMARLGRGLVGARDGLGALRLAAGTA